MNNASYKNAITQVTSLQAGLDGETWKVREGSAWRELTIEEKSMVEVEYSAQEDIRITEEAKQAKDAALASITVTTANGNTFDGRDIDQQRMMAAILSSDVVGMTETPWKLADDIVVVVSLTELKEALALSIQALGDIILGVE